MTSLEPEEVIFTIADPRSVGVLASEIIINTIETNTLLLPAITVNNALTQVIVRDPADNSMHFNTTIANAASSLAPIGAAPNADGATLVAGVLNLEPASAVFGGVVASGAQTFPPGVKTFQDVATQQNVDLPATISAAVGNITINAVPFAHAMAGGTFVGRGAGNYAITGLLNTVVGSGAGTALAAGGSNIFVGASAGTAIVATSNNVCIANAGVLGDAGVIRIGTAGTQTTAFIAGIAGTAIGGAPSIVVVDPASGQLGTSAFHTSITYHPFNSGVNFAGVFRLWIPTPGGNNGNDQSGVSNYQSTWTAPYNGRLARVIIRASDVTGHFPAAELVDVTFGFSVNGATNSNPAPTFFSTIIPTLFQGQQYAYDAPLNWTFLAGNVLRIALDSAVPTGVFESGDWYVAAAWNFS